MDLFHMVFSGPERAAEAFVDDLVSHGFPAQTDRLCAGFEAELLVAFVEALGDGDLGDVDTPGSPLALAQAAGFRLRMHGWVSSQHVGDQLADRVAALEAQIARMS